MELSDDELVALVEQLPQQVAEFQQRVSTLEAENAALRDKLDQRDEDIRRITTRLKQY